MKVQKLGIGKQIEVGDVILHDSWTGKTWHKVIRVTSKFAVIRWNDVAEGKFPRVIPNVGLRPCGPRDIWSTVQYSAWRPVPPEVSEKG